MNLLGSLSLCTFIYTHFLLCILNLATHMSTEYEEEVAKESTISNILNLDCSTILTASCKNYTQSCPYNIF